MNDYQYGVVAGLVTVFVIAVIIGVLIRKINGGHTMKGEYDERQILARGKGYRIGFLFYMFEMVVMLIISSLELTLPFTDSALYAILFILPIGTTSVYFILNDAYMGLNSNKKFYIRLSIVVAVANLITFGEEVITGGCFEKGKLSGNILNLGVAILFVA
ncbi:MAG: hypothetical protein K5773_06415, partial [Pseudobutyrivibrio sp.]|nr:hypothetical protein [Pseudobutyrivibrio sp.]